VVQECEEATCLGIPAVILFGIPERKDPAGTEAYSTMEWSSRCSRPAAIALSAFCKRQIGHSCLLARKHPCGFPVSGEVNDLRIGSRTATSFLHRDSSLRDSGQCESNYRLCCRGVGVTSARSRAATLREHRHHYTFSDS
jgi:hypothetical protein